jgi:transposase
MSTHGNGRKPHGLEPDAHEAMHVVLPEDACLQCGERECDELVWLDDERVECQQCGTVYRPSAKNVSST